MVSHSFKARQTRLRFTASVVSLHKTQHWGKICRQCVIKSVAACYRSPWTQLTSIFTVWGLAGSKLGPFQHLLASVHAGASLLKQRVRRLWSAVVSDEAGRSSRTNRRLFGEGLALPWRQLPSCLSVSRWVCPPGDAFLPNTANSHTTTQTQYESYYTHRFIVWEQKLLICTEPVPSSLAGDWITALVSILNWTLYWKWVRMCQQPGCANSCTHKSIHTTEFRCVCTWFVTFVYLNVKRDAQEFMSVWAIFKRFYFINSPMCEIDRFEKKISKWIINIESTEKM